MPFKCVGLCDGNPCAGELENTECYVDHPHDQPVESKCRNPCLSGTDPCRSKGDSFACRPKAQGEGGDELPYKCVDLCAEKPCAHEVENTICHVDHDVQPAVVTCRNYCYGPPTEKCRAMGDKFACRPKLRDERGFGLPYKCVDLCAEQPNLCALGGDLYYHDKLCYADHTAQHPVAQCRSICTLKRCRDRATFCVPRTTKPYYFCEDYSPWVRTPCALQDIAGPQT